MIRGEDVAAVAGGGDPWTRMAQAGSSMEYGRVVEVGDASARWKWERRMVALMQCCCEGAMNG